MTPNEIFVKLNIINIQLSEYAKSFSKISPIISAEMQGMANDIDRIKVFLWEEQASKVDDNKPGLKRTS